MTTKPSLLKDTCMLKPRSILILMLAVALGATVRDADARKGNDGAPIDPAADPMMRAAGFLEAHPDIRYRLLGLDEYRDNNYADALRFFQRAAHYADKPSQGMVAEMYWSGQGIAQDRPLAYAWMDLAAERGYQGFIGLRERYWNALDPAERQRALSVGEDVYARYGDAAAQERIARVLRRERKKLTGSRTGFVGNVQVYVPTAGGFAQIDGSKFWDSRYWDPQEYRQWQDSVWMTPRIGRVEVGEFEQVQEGSRVPPVKPNVEAEEPRTPARDETGLGTRPHRP